MHATDVRSLAFHMDTLELTWSMPNGQPGVDDSPENPLARATDRLFRLGQPFSRLNNCFLHGVDNILRWLGIFVHSAGDRLLFFPGFATPQKHVVGYNEEILRWNQSFSVDHLSLERDWKTWHVTATRSIDHLGKLATRQLDGNRVYWFSMSVAAQNDLRKVRRETRVVSVTPPQDVDGRAAVFQASREGAVFQTIKLNTEHPLPPRPIFLHFSVVVGRSGFDSPQNELLGLPCGVSLVVPAAGDWPEQVPIRTHRVLVSESIELEIKTSVLRGELRMPIVFSCPARGSESSTGKTRV